MFQDFLQRLFVPLLALAALAWLYVRLDAVGAFAAIRDSVRRMSAFQRFAAAAFLAVFVVYAGTKTDAGASGRAASMMPPRLTGDGCFIETALPGLADVPRQLALLDSSCGLPVPLPAEPFAAPSDGAATNLRLLDGRCFLNGTQTVAEEVDKNEFE